jgi:hypothetical protein
LGCTSIERERSSEVSKKSKEVEQESDKAGSDGREPETDDEAAGKDKTTAEGSGSGLEDSDNEHERGKRSVSTTPMRRLIGTFYLLAQKLLVCNSDLDKSATVCKVGDLEGSPKPFWIWKHIHVHKIHVYEVYAHEVHAMRCTPMRYMTMRYTP